MTHANMCIETCPLYSMYAVNVVNSADAMEFAAQLQSKVQRVKQRFQLKCGDRASGCMDSRCVRHCDVAFKLLHGLIRRISGTVFFRLQQLWPQVCDCLHV
jgi:hypothetical protein